MNWERHLREMILAGGALVAAACSGTGASGGAQGPSDASEEPMQGIGCNACTDPCIISGPDGAIDLVCEEMACVNGGGAFVDGLCMNPPPPLPTPDAPDGGPVDAAPADAETGPSDAALMEDGEAGPADASASDAADAAGD